MTVDRAKLDGLLALLDRGSAVEPANGYYPVLKAGALFKASSKVRARDPDDQKPGWSPQAGWIIDRVDITNAATFRQGLAALEDAAGKPYIDGHVFELARRRLALFPPPRGVGEDLLRTHFEIAILLPYLHEYRAAFQASGGHAVALAEAGDVAAADRILNHQRRIALMVTARAPVLVELLVARGLTTLTDAQQAVAYKEAGREADFRLAAGRVHEQERSFRALREPPDAGDVRAWLAGAGVVQRTMIPSGTDPARVDFGPGRRAGYAVADQFAAAGLAAVLLAAAGRWLVPAVLAASSRRRRHQHVAAADRRGLFIGWSRLAAVVLAAAVLPVAAYLLLAHLTPLGGRSRGVGHTWLRLGLEYATLAAVVVLLLRAAVVRAVVARAAELGVPVVRPTGDGPLLVNLALVAVAATAFAVSWVRSQAAADSPIGPLLVILLLVLVALTAATLWPRRGRGSDVAVHGQGGAATRSFWTRRRPGSVTALLAIAAGACFWLAQPSGPPWYRVDDTFIFAAFVACAGVLLGTVAFGAVVTARRAARAGRRGSGDGPAAVPSVWQAAPRSAATVYAAAALAVGLLGGTALRWQERRQVDQFAAAGYGFLE